MTRGILRDRDFRLFFTGQLTSGFGDALISIALAFATLQVTDSPSAVGLVLIASRAPVIVFALAGGVVGDALDRRRVMLTCDVLRVVVQASTALLLFTHRASLAALLVLQCAAGLGGAFFAPAAAASVPFMVGRREDLAAANGLMGVSRSLAQIAALGASGVLVATVGPAWAFAIDAGTFGVSAVTLSLVRRRAAVGERGVARPSLVRQLADGWQPVRRSGWMPAAMLYLALINTLAIAPFLALGPYIAQRELGGARAWAAVAIGYAVGALAGNAIILRWRPRNPLRTAHAVVFLLVPLLALLALGAPVELLVPAAVLAGGQGAVYTVLYATTIQQSVPADVLARVSSWSMTVSVVAAPVGMGLAGPLAALIGVRSLFTGSAVWVAASTGGMLVLLARRSRVGAADVGAPEVGAPERVALDLGALDLGGAEREAPGLGGAVLSAPGPGRPGAPTARCDTRPQGR